MGKSEERGSTDQKQKGPGRQATILKGTLVFAILAAGGYFGYFYHRTAPGEPCSQSWHCATVDGHAAPECREVVGRGTICALPCEQSQAPKAGCPSGLSCDQLLWDEGGEARTSWFCLPRRTVP